MESRVGEGGIRSRCGLPSTEVGSDRIDPEGQESRPGSINQDQLVDRTKDEPKALIHMILSP